MLIRYCAPCNLVHPPRFTREAKKRGCAQCGAGLVIVDDASLLAQLGRKLDTAQREDATKKATMR